ncbi:MAG: sugar phosphorylase, partial [Chloroflexota bacterium]
MPLQTLRKTLLQTIYPTVNGLHILPFSPYSSDDGFSVIDYIAVDPALGSWNDVRAFKPEFRLMFDAVINHISAQSAWFQGFLRGEDPYREYFIPMNPATDLSLVTRPRALPLLSPFESNAGTQHLWTTFSDDQIDLNYANPDVLIAILRVLLFYVEQGANLIRLDAIAFMWKCVGTTCLHLPETHAVIQLMRDVLDVVAPQVILVTETNVPHIENISYFGSGDDEAQMVYQFSLPPLTLHTFRTGDATVLSRWAATIERASERTTFFNFTASHDGIGVRPALGLLTDAEIAALVKLTEDHGGLVSYKNNPDGTQSPYELNITYFDAITDPAITATQPDIAISRFICSQAIMLAMVGVPGIYLHSLFGSRNFREGVQMTGRNRTINREKLNADDLLDQLSDESSLRHRVF